MSIIKILRYTDLQVFHIFIKKLIWLVSGLFEKNVYNKKN